MFGVLRVKDGQTCSESEARMGYREGVELGPYRSPPPCIDVAWELSRVNEKAPYLVMWPGFEPIAMLSFSRLSLQMD